MSFLHHASRSSWTLRIVVLSLLFVSLVALLFRTSYAALAAQQALMPTRTPRLIAQTDVNPYGANFFLSREVEPWKIDKTLQMASQAGIGWVKQHFPWEEVEPQRKGEYRVPGTNEDSWAKFDRIVEACEKYDLRVIARLDRPPDWTREDNTYKERPPDDLEDYGDYVYAFVQRYAGRIDYIQIWNEPNIFPEWGNRPVDPQSYVELLKVAYRRAKEANPNVYVLSAPLAITLGQAHPEPGKWIAMSDLQFLEEMYQAGAGSYFDIMSANAFGMDRLPEDPPDPQVLNFQRVLLQRQIMERYGDADKAVWFDEYGWNAAPASFPAEQLIWQRVSEQEQAEYTLRGIQYARENWPWAGVFNIWYFRQVGNLPSDRADYYFRMVDVDFTPRRVYYAVQDVASIRGAAGPGRYEETYPGIVRYGQWHNAIDHGASAGGLIASETEGDSLTFTFQGSGVDLIAKRGPWAGRLSVTLDGHEVPGLTTDAQGTSLIDLYAPAEQTQSRVPLVRLTSNGEHTVRITVDASQHAGASGQRCVLDAFDVIQETDTGFPWIQVAFYVVGLGIDVYLLWRSWRRLGRSPRG